MRITQFTTTVMGKGDSSRFALRADAMKNTYRPFPGSPVLLTFHFEFTANDHIAVLDIHP